MSFRAKMERVAYIDGRLRHKKDYPSAVQLARDYAELSGDTITARSIKRDIEWMREQAAPIEYDPRHRGYYYAGEDYVLPAIRLSAGDLLAITVAERALESYRNSPYYERVRSVFDRLAKLLPERVSVQSGELSQRVSVIAEPATEIRDEVWDALRRGLEGECTLAVHYRAPGYSDTSVRMLDPYHVVGHRGQWYLLAHSHHDAEVRIYALNRILKCTVTKDRFTRPPGFSPADHIDPSFGIFRGEEEQEVAIRFAPHVAAQIKERQWHPGQRIEDQPDGGVVLRYDTNQMSQTLFWVGQWGPNAEILEPSDLRNRAAEWFRATATLYA
ncbi:MAG: helix-turn-helix transcriptional regulator [Spirochaetales bacterium]